MNPSQKLVSIIFLLCAHLLVVNGAGSAFAQETREANSLETPGVVLDPELDKELQTMRSEMLAAFKRRDFKLLNSYVTPDIIVTWQNGEVTKGTDALMSFNERMLGGDNSVISEADAAPIIEGRKLFGDQIISIGAMNDSFTIRATGQKLPFNSRFSALVVKQDGRYLVSGLHLSANVFDNPVLSAATNFYKLLAGATAVVALIFGILIGKFLLCRK